MSALNINMIEGIPKRLTLKFMDSCDQLIDVSSGIIRGAIDNGVIIDGVIDEGIDGIAYLVIPEMSPGVYVWDCFMLINNVERRVVQGRVRVSTRITPNYVGDDPHNMYASVIIGDGEDYSVTVTLDEQPTELARSYAQEAKQARDDTDKIKTEVVDIGKNIIRIEKLAKESATSAKESEEKAKTDADRAETAVQGIDGKVTATGQNATTASEKAQIATDKASEASTYAGEAKTSEENAKASEGEAKKSANASATSATASESSATASAQSATDSETAKKGAVQANADAQAIVNSISPETIARTDEANTFSKPLTVDIGTISTYTDALYFRYKVGATARGLKLVCESSSQGITLTTTSGSGSFFLTSQMSLVNWGDTMLYGNVLCSTGLECRGAAIFKQKANLLNGGTVPAPVLADDVVPKKYVDDGDYISHYVNQKVYFDTLTNAGNLFKGDKTIIVFNYDLPLCTSMVNCFFESGIEKAKINAIKCTNLSNAFYESKIKTLELCVGGVDINMVLLCYRTFDAESITVDFLEGATVARLDNAFTGSNAHTILINSNNIKSMYRAYSYASNLVNLNLNYPNAVGMDRCFEGCSSITSSQITSVMNSLPNRVSSGDYVNNSISGNKGVIGFVGVPAVTEIPITQWEDWAFNKGWGIELSSGWINKPEN